MLAFVTARGSSNSHTAILARNMNIPAVIGVGDEFLSDVKEGDEAIVDGFDAPIFRALKYIMDISKNLVLVKMVFRGARFFMHLYQFSL